MLVRSQGSGNQVSGNNTGKRMRSYIGFWINSGHIEDEILTEHCHSFQLVLVLELEAARSSGLGYGFTAKGFRYKHSNRVQIIKAQTDAQLKQLGCLIEIW